MPVAVLLLLLTPLLGLASYAGGGSPVTAPAASPVPAAPVSAAADTATATITVSVSPPPPVVTEPVPPAPQVVVGTGTAALALPGLPGLLAVPSVVEATPPPEVLAPLLAPPLVPLVAPAVAPQERDDPALTADLLASGRPDPVADALPAVVLAALALVGLLVLLRRRA